MTRVDFLHLASQQSEVRHRGSRIGVEVYRSEAPPRVTLLFCSTIFCLETGGLRTDAGDLKPAAKTGQISDLNHALKHWTSGKRRKRAHTGRHTEHESAGQARMTQHKTRKLGSKKFCCGLPGQDPARSDRTSSHSSFTRPSRKQHRHIRILHLHWAVKGLAPSVRPDAGTSTIHEDTYPERRARP